MTFRSLRCTLNKNHFLQLFECLKVSPNLDKLELHRKHADQRSLVGPTVISGSMPSLTDLRLASIDLTPEVPQLRYLVNLDLAHPFPSLAGVLDLVASNPLLETITFSLRCTGKTNHRPEGAILIRVSALSSSTSTHLCPCSTGAAFLEERPCRSLCGLTRRNMR